MRASYRTIAAIAGTMIVLVSCQAIVRSNLQKVSGPATFCCRNSDWWAYQIMHYDQMHGRYGPCPSNRSALLEVVKCVTGIDYGAEIAAGGDGGVLLLQGYPGSLSVVIELLHHSDATVRRFALDCLAAIHEKVHLGIPVRDELSLMLDDRDERVRQSAKRLIEKIDHREQR